MKTTCHTILYVHQDGLITGSAISLRNVIQGLDRTRYTPIVMLARDGEARSLYQELDVAIYVFEFDTFWTSPGPRCLSRENFNQYKALIPSKNLRAFIHQLKPDLIHINDKAALQVGISMRKSGIPMVQHSRSAFHNTQCRLNAYLSSRMIKSYAQHIIAISEDEVQGFETSTNLTVLFNTVNLFEAKKAKEVRNELRISLGIKQDEVVIGMAENMSIRKGLLDIMSIIRDVKKKAPLAKVKFLMVGELSETDSLKSIGIAKSSHEYFTDFLTKENLKEDVLLVGHQTKVLNYIAAMDIIIISKSHGVLGRQPIEAQAVGTTVLAINGHSKKSTLVQQGEGGFLVNNIEELTNTLLGLLKQPSQLRQHGLLGQVYAKEHFDIKNYSEKLGQIYTQYITN